MGECSAVSAIKKQIKEKPTIHIIQDSKEGWANAFVLGLKAWFDGKDVKFDYSMIRPAGARLEQLVEKLRSSTVMDLMEFARRKILAKQVAVFPI